MISIVEDKFTVDINSIVSIAWFGNEFIVNEYHNLYGFLKFLLSLISVNFELFPKT